MKGIQGIPKDGEIWTIKTSGNRVWVFRSLKFINNSRPTEYTGCDNCICIDGNGDTMFHNFTSKGHGYIGYDDQIQLLRPANLNELAIYKRTFIE